MQMTTSSTAYLLPGPSSTIGSKSPLIKQMLPTAPATLHSVSNVAHHQVQLPLHRSSISSHSHQQFSRPTSNTDTFHSLTVPHTNNVNSLLTVTTTSNNNPNNIEENGGGSGSSGHSLSQSMESINNIGFTDDEVSNTIIHKTFTISR
ncbi:hypothetical protein I4U23_018690 [Adineta vaga]|nr:hypothetical protein I4U23_018690 [Adineta vaga]